MTRAVIPVDQARHHKNTPDLWDAGQKYRDAYDAAQAKKAETKWIREAQPWAYTEADYREAPVQ